MQAAEKEIVRLLQMQENAILYSMATRRMSNIVTEMKTVINVGK